MYQLFKHCVYFNWIKRW